MKFSKLSYFMLQFRGISRLSISSQSISYLPFSQQKFGMFNASHSYEYRIVFRLVLLRVYAAGDGEQ